MLTILATLVPIFGIMGLGIFADRRQMLPAATASCLNQFVYWFSLPLLLFHQLAIMRPEEIRGSVAWGYVLGLALCLLTGYVLFRLLGEQRRNALMLGLVGSFPNGAFMGMPVILLLYPGDGPAALAASLAVVLTGTNMIFVDTVLGVGDSAGEKRSLWQGIVRVLRPLLHNPMLVCSALGAAVGILGIPLPQTLLVMAKMVGSTASPCALFCMGMALSAQVSGMAAKSPPENGTGAEAGSRAGVAWLRRQLPVHIFKLFVSPALVYAMIWLLGGRGTALASGTIMAGMSTAVVAFVLAEKYDAVAGDTSMGIVVNTALAAVSLPLVIAVVQWAAL